MKDNFLQMPPLLKWLSLLGISAPLISIIAVTGSQNTDIANIAVNNIALNGYEMVGMMIPSTPIFFASISMMKKCKLSRWGYILGLIIISILSLTLSLIYDSNTESIYSNVEQFMINLLYYFAFILGVWFYLFKNKNVASYFFDNT